MTLLSQYFAIKTSHRAIDAKDHKPLAISSIDVHEAQAISLCSIASYHSMLYPSLIVPIA